MYLPTKSLFTLAMKSSGLKSRSSTFALSFGDVIAQPFRVHAEAEVAQRVDARAARFRHLVARDGDEAVNVDVVRRLVAGELEHRRPEQGVEVDDVLADEVDHLGVRRGEEFLEAARLAVLAGLAGVEIVFQAREIADRRIQPDIQILFLPDVGNADAEVGRVARDVPVGERLLALALEPFLRFVRNLRLEPVRLVDPFAKKLLALGIGQPAEVVLGGLQYRLRARER